MRTDAKIYAMIDDLSRESLADLLNIPVESRHLQTSRKALAMDVRRGYESGQISESDIIDAWEDEEE